MAKFEERSDTQTGLTVITAIGDVAPGEMLAYRALRDNGKRTSLLLWDLTRANWSNIPTHALLRDIDRVRLFSHENYRTAFVLGNEVDYGMGRIVESYTEVQGFPGEYRPFLNLDEAFAWLMSEHKEQFDSSDYAVAFGM